MIYPFSYNFPDSIFFIYFHQDILLLSNKWNSHATFDWPDRLYKQMMDADDWPYFSFNFMII